MNIKDKICGKLYFIHIIYSYRYIMMIHENIFSVKEKSCIRCTSYFSAFLIIRLENVFM
jgi:hypothetical protein